MIHIKVTYSCADLLLQEKSQIIYHTNQETIIPLTSQLPTFNHFYTEINCHHNPNAIKPNRNEGEFSMLKADSPKPQTPSFQADVLRKREQK